MSTTIAERVEAGAAWLDLNRPGWVDRIDLETLDLGEPCRCILGQEYGEYQNMPDLLWESGLVHPYGFNAAVFGTWAQRTDEFDALTAAWRELIERRRAS